MENVAESSEKELLFSEASTWSVAPEGSLEGGLWDARMLTSPGKETQSGSLFLRSSPAGPRIRQCSQPHSTPLRQHQSLQSLNTRHYLDFLNPSTALIPKPADSPAEPVRKPTQCGGEEAPGLPLCPSAAPPATWALVEQQRREERSLKAQLIPSNKPRCGAAGEGR